MKRSNTTCTSMLTVTIVIVGTNEKHWLEPALNSIKDAKFLGNLTIIYVDNNSSDGSISFIKSHFPSVKIISNSQNLGFSGANNEGIKAALKQHTDYIFLVNPDTRMPKNLISALVSFMESHREFGAIGPLQARYGQPIDKQLPELNEWSQQALANGKAHLFQPDFSHHTLVETTSPSSKEVPPLPPTPKNVLEHSYIQGAALFLRASILPQVGLFDTTYHTFYEEVDLCRRIRWYGYKIGLLTDQFIQHTGGGSTKESLYKKKLMMRNKYYFLITDPSWKLFEMSQLLFRWIAHDIKRMLFYNPSLFITNLIWILSNLLKAWQKRMEYKRVSPHRTVRILRRT